MFYQADASGNHVHRGLDHALHHSSGTAFLAGLHVHASVQRREAFDRQVLFNGQVAVIGAPGSGLI
jgi:hypothetical protein